MREISIHASTREVTYWSRSFVLGECWFQSTLPRGKRQFTIYLNKYSKLISIHASAREATRCEFKMIFVLNISIHASAREATTVCDYCRVGGHISIHASAREATYLPLRERIIDVISIHASARGATIYPLLLRLLDDRFQSTLPRGKRRFSIFHFDPQPIISIHASAREATYLLQYDSMSF